MKWYHLVARSLTVPLTVALATLIATQNASTQTFPTEDPVIKAIWEQGMEEESQIERLAQVLLDSIGPRLSGSPGQRSAIDWAVQMYEDWGVPVRREQYGTWRGWDRGYTHIDLIEPRQRTLNGTMLAWSPGTEGPIEGDVIAMPSFGSRGDFDRWLPGVAGRFVALSYAEPTCRAPESWAALATPESVVRNQQRQQRIRTEWAEGIRNAGGAFRVIRMIEDAGAAGVLTALWSNGWGANKIFSASTDRIPSLHLSCEDYGLVHRLASNDQGPRLRLDAESEFLGDVPVFNVVGELRGLELPDEYVLLTAHLDSWDGASGATDNGTGSAMMMEAMRILKEVYPRPRRTILVAH